MENLVKIIDSIIWPLTVIFIFFMVRKPISLLLPFVENFKYKDLEVKFKKDLNEAIEKSELPVEDIQTSSEDKEEISRLLEASPSYAIIEAWKEIEHEAKIKVSQLVTDKEKLVRAQKQPITHLELTGALIPSTAQAIRGLRKLRNEAAHNRDLKLSKESAIEYVSLAKAVSDKIKAITEFPKLKHNVLTLLILEYNHLIDTGKYTEISIADVQKQIEDRNIIPFLEEVTKGDSDFSIFTGSTTFSEHIPYYYEQMYQIYGGYSGGEKWGVENSGLCLLVALTNEIIQRGSGWHPYQCPFSE